jgi:N-acetylglucosamine-6-phosphate deacetylase
MPQLHHRDPSIIGLLGASPHLASPFTPLGGSETDTFTPPSPVSTPIGAEAMVEQYTPPQSPQLKALRKVGRVPKLPGGGLERRRSELHFEKGQVADMDFERPFYELIVDGIHLHPNSVRVSNGPACHILSLTALIACLQRISGGLCSHHGW